ncbi:LuxR family transcriptional regulator [Planotetraspora phitsanulokensis]|uniref:Helix-turn-helix transcriptional regulator n=1 Tax=Planotetraspora phitsanulokensis TaxID=575192 RepID=A0A8J3U9P1_9ACTN|nr:LuxR family transcriptional regulator [Planotetraspora phitsanulokensis]GII41198.1 helix-turn-helix transcriptional regulator [Planotetraspora phitsanulokensis]
MLLGRDPELEVVDRLVDGVRASTGRALVVVGEPGIGKSALMDHAMGRAGQEMRVLRVAGVEGEAELPYSALHLLLRPVLDRIEVLPALQASALRAAFGMEPAAGADRLLVGLATLTLLSDLAAERPLLCLVDDGHWVDTASAAALHFVGRRLEHDPIGLIVAVREQGGPSDHASSFATLPVMRLAALPREAATALLAREAPELPARLRNRVLAAARGNPLALRELPKTVDDEEPSGTDPLPITECLRRAFTGQIDRLEDAARKLLVIIAAEGTGDLGTVMRVADLLGVPRTTLAEAERAGLVVVTAGSVRFRHPLVRTAAYQGALFTQRQVVHQALAMTVETSDPHRWAWHLAAAAFGPDEHAAAALERTAESSLQRDGQAVAVAAYERSAQLSEDGPARSRRLSAAAMAAIEAGQFVRAGELCDAAARLTDEPAVLARLAGARGRLEFERGNPRAAARLMIDGAAKVPVEAPEDAAEMLVLATYYAGHGVDLPLAGQAVTMLNSLDLPANHGFQPYMRQARGLYQLIAGEAADHATFEALRPTSVWEQSWTARALNFAGRASEALEISTAMVAQTRADGLIGHLANALFHQSCAQTLLGRCRAAAESAEQGLMIAADTDQGSVATYLRGLLAWLAALDGDDQRCRAFADEAIRYADDHGAPPSAADATWALALLDLGNGRYESALSRMENRWQGWPHSSARVRATADHIEAAVRAGEPGIAARLIGELDADIGKLLDPCAPSIIARCRALVSPAREAEHHFVTALRQGECQDRPFDRARTLFAYGTWLRREHRKTEARSRLRAAVEIFQRSGATLWASRAQGELRATGDRSATRSPEPGLIDRLTPQEFQIVRLAATGATNRDIGTQLFISPRTVAQHLYRAFPKLGITTRTELAALNLDL